MKNSDDSGYTGKHVGVCVLDTGIFPHIDFTGRILAFQDFIGHRIRPYDDNSHGTHVCGIIGGDGRASEGRIRGIAPGCSLIVLKVLDRTGNGRKEDVLQAFRWILENKRYYGIRVVNISVGTTCRSQSSDRGCGTTLGCRSGGSGCGRKSGTEGRKCDSTGKQPEDYHSRLQRSAYRTDCHIRQGTYI